MITHHHELPDFSLGDNYFKDFIHWAIWMGVKIAGILVPLVMLFALFYIAIADGAVHETGFHSSPDNRAIHAGRHFTGSLVDGAGGIGENARLHYGDSA